MKSVEKSLQNINADLSPLQPVQYRLRLACLDSLRVSTRDKKEPATNAPDIHTANNVLDIIFSQVTLAYSSSSGYRDLKCA